MAADLVLPALNVAITQRQPTDVIHHSGTRYTRSYVRSAVHEDGCSVLNGKCR